MSSSIIRASLPESRRARHELIGQLAEQAVGEKLAKIYGNKNVKSGRDGYSGTNGEPDILVDTEDGLLFIEVKSFKPFTRNYINQKGKTTRKRIYRPSSVKVNRDSWKALCQGAEPKYAKVFLIAEARLYDDDIYFLLPKKQVDKAMKKTNATWVHFQLWYVLHFCHVLQFKREEFLFTDRPGRVSKKNGQQRLRI